MRSRIVVLGAGSWGTALAIHLSRAGRDVLLWARRADLASEMRRGRNTRYLPSAEIPAAVEITSDIDLALELASSVLLAVPSSATAELCQAVRPRAAHGVPVVLLAKGFERGSGRRLSEVAIGELGPEHPALVLLGPSHAEEVAAGLPTAIVLAGPASELRTEVQHALSGPTLRVYTNDDLVGVETAAALKNVLAIAAGICDGLALGDNAKGALLARGLAEIVRVGVALGGDPATFYGLSGVGDIITTGLSRHSRNRALGERVGRGESLASARASIGMVVEGVETTRTVLSLADRHHIEVPISREVGAVLFDGKDPRRAIEDLMVRSLKAEGGETP